MPRIPAPSTVRVTPLPSGERGMAERAGNIVARNLSVALLDYADASSKQEFVNLSGELDRQLLQIETDIERDPEIKTASDATRIYQERAEPVVEQILGQSRWRASSTALTARAQEATLRGHASVSRTGYAKEVDFAKASFDVNEDTYSERYARSEDPDERMGILAKFRTDVEISEFLSEQEKQARIDRLDRRAAKERAIRLMNSGRFKDAEAFIESEEASSVLDDTDIYNLRTTLSMMGNKAATDARRAERAAKNLRTSLMLDRIYNEQNPQGFPTIQEILDADLGRIPTEHFIDLAKRRARGEDLNKIDESLVNNLYVDVHSRRIDQFEQLLPYIGNGLPRDEAEKLRLDIEALQNPEAKATAKMLNAFFIAANGTLDRSTNFFKDPKGPRLFYEFRVEAMRLYNQGIQSGKTPIQLLDPKSQDYIGKLLNSPHFMRSDKQVLEDMREAMRQSPEAVPSIEQMRKEGESVEDYLERTK